MRMPIRIPTFPARLVVIALALGTCSLLFACAKDEPTAPAAEASRGDAALVPAGTLWLGPGRALPAPDGCGQVLATDINDDGVVVGTTFLCPDGKAHAVRWDAAGTWIYLPEVNGLVLHPFDIANDGTITAYTERQPVGHDHVYAVRPDGRIEELPLPDFPGSTLYVLAGPNAQGTLLLREEPTPGTSRFHLWKGHGRPVTIPEPATGFFTPSDLNDRGDVAGTIRTGDTFEASTWHQGSGFRLLTAQSGALSTSGDVIDNSGRVFGVTELSVPATCPVFGASVGRASIWSRATAPLLPSGDQFECAAAADFRDVTRDGLAAGALSYRTQEPLNRAFIMAADGRWAIAPCEVSGVVATEGCQGVAVNRTGTLVGTYISPPEIRSVVWPLNAD